MSYRPTWSKTPWGSLWLGHTAKVSPPLLGPSRVTVTWNGVPGSGVGLAAGSELDQAYKIQLLSQGLRVSRNCLGHRVLWVGSGTSKGQGLSVLGAGLSR